MSQTSPTTPDFAVESGPGSSARVRLSGDWSKAAALPRLGPVEEALSHSPQPSALEFDASSLTGWNTGLLAFVIRCRELCDSKGITFTPGSLPEGLQRLIELSLAVPEKKDAKRSSATPPFLQRVGEASILLGQTGLDLVTFIGESLQALWQAVRGRARFRWSDAFLVMQETWERVKNRYR